MENCSDSYDVVVSGNKGYTIIYLSHACWRCWAVCLIAGVRAGRGFHLSLEKRAAGEPVGSPAPGAAILEVGRIHVHCSPEPLMPVLGAWIGTQSHPVGGCGEQASREHLCGPVAKCA